LSNGQTLRTACESHLDVTDRVTDAANLQTAIMGYLPGYATPRIACDVPLVGKRWVHQAVRYDRELGISYWTKNHRTVLDSDDPAAPDRRYPFSTPLIRRRRPAGSGGPAVSAREAGHPGEESLIHP
jgi:hypothetical protein